MKKLILTSLIISLALSVFTGCKDNQGAIAVISREEGSGTRSAFTELMGIAKNNTDNTTVNAEVTNSTSVMITTVAGNTNAIGYISLGSLNGSVKAVKIDGTEATAENIKNGTYKISRPFNIVLKDNPNEISKDFISYMLSAEGQKIIESEGYISVSNGKSFKESGKSGKITLAGSTSVAPVMEVLTEEYKKLNPDVSIEIQQSGSSAGITSVKEGVCDIGMASRELNDSEKSDGLTAIAIAMDGIAVIINDKNKIDSLTSEQIRDVFTGKITKWAEIG